MLGHTKIAGNEEANKLAKLATSTRECILEPEETSFAYLSILINKIKKDEIYSILESNKKSKTKESYSSIYSWKVSNKMLLPISTKRELASSFYQLKLGHGYLKSYLYRLNISSDNKCICGLTETAKHLLLDCKSYENERKALLESIRKDINVRNLALSLILHTKIGIKSLLVFLKETNICTRSWHNQRIEEEREREEERGDFIL